MKYIKTFEYKNDPKPKFKTGDEVYVWNYDKTILDTEHKYIVLRLWTRDYKLVGRYFYKLDGINHFINKDINIPEGHMVNTYEIDANKYNL